MKKSHITTKIKHELLKKADNKCPLCGIDLTLENTSISHIKPKSKGETTSLDNLQVLCNKCNVSKVIKALDDKSWEYRTVSGVSKETNLNENIVRTVMEKANDRIRESYSVSKNGNKLYTLKNRKSTWADIWTSMKKLSNDKFEVGE